ncbi:MAG: glycine cleavage T C-terminal barrel domain-containing protein [Anaerolineales bacterium]
MISVTEKGPPKDYLASRDSVAYYVIPNPGYLTFSGETRQEYLQRQTTNDLGLLSSNRALPNFLTSASGRILEFFTMLQDGEGIGMLTQPGHGHGLADYFRKRIFFNDKVAVEDRSTEWVHVELYGPMARQPAQAVGFEKVPEEDEVLTVDETRLIGLNQGGFQTRPYILLSPLLLMPKVMEILSSLEAVALTHKTREILRIEAGQPGDPEFNGDYTPFELGMDRYVSTEKGCYTGQEVLARQVTYDKIVRTLVQVRSTNPIAVGASVVAEGKNVGQVTSAAFSPTYGPVALAMLRKPFDSPGMSLELADGENHANGVVFLP